MRRSDMKYLNNLRDISTGVVLLFIMLVISLPSVTPAAESIDSKLDGDDFSDDYSRGWIDWMKDNAVVIDDTQYLRSRNTRFFDKNHKSVGSGYFTENMYVVFKASDDYQLVAVYEQENDIDDLPVSERRFRNARDKSDQSDKKQQYQMKVPRSEIFMENGVWKN